MVYSRLGRKFALGPRCFPPGPHENGRLRCGSLERCFYEANGARDRV